MKRVPGIGASNALAAVVFAFAVVSSAIAGAELRLADGQVLRGADVRRDGDVYVLTLDNGSAISLPSDLVTSVRLEDEAKPAPTGIVVAEQGTVLAGAEVRPPRTDEQLAVLGEPSKFATGPHDPTWRPKEAFDPNVDVLADSRSTWSPGVVDPEWVPESAFDGRDDVLADGRASFSGGVVDPSWRPSDGFQRKNLSFVLARNARIAAEIGAASAWTCAENLIAGSVDGRADRVQVARMDRERFRAVPIPLFRAEGEHDGRERRAVFTTAGGVCEPLFVNDSAVPRAEAAFNAAVGRESATTGAIAGEPLAYALAVVALFESGTTTGDVAALELLDDPEDLSSLGDAGDGGCSARSRTRKRALREAQHRIAAPTVVADEFGRVVTFHAWNPEGGDVSRHVVTVGRDGAVSVSSEVVASHVGRHVERTAVSASR